MMLTSFGVISRSAHQPLLARVPRRDVQTWPGDRGMLPLVHETKNVSVVPGASIGGLHRLLPSSYRTCT